MNQQFTSATYEKLTTRKDLVAEALRDSILRGAFAPGEKLDQQRIADDLAVSRSPVREALRTLDAEGLITLIPNRGAVVTERSLTELKELYATRALVEGAAIERAAASMTDRILALVENILDDADKTDDFEELLVLNNQFHMLTYSAVAQPFLTGFIQQLRNMAAPYNRLYLDLLGTKDRAWQDHRRIYEACRKRDGARAKAEIHRHLEHVIRAIARSIEGGS